MSLHPQHDVEVVYLRNAGWCWRCHRCDVNGFNLASEAAARRDAAPHLPAANGTP